MNSKDLGCIAMQLTLQYAGHMRLDKFLKLSRLIKRRTVANSVASAGHIWVNGKLAKPAYLLDVGDELLIQLGEHRHIRVKVLIIPTTKSVPPDLASTLYQPLNEEGTMDNEH